MGIIRRRAIAIVIPAALALLGGAVGATAAAQVEVVMPGVSVGGVRLEGLSGPALKTRLAEEAEGLERRSIDISVREASFKIRPVDLGITADVPTTAGLALSVGRPGPFEWMLHKLRPRVTKITWRQSVNPEKLDKELDRIAGKVRQESLSGDVRIVDGHPIITLPLPGVELDKASARRELLRHALNGNVAAMQLPVITASPSIGQLEVARAETQVRTLLSAPVEFVTGGRKIVLPPEVIASTLLVRPIFSDPDEAGSKADLIVQADPVKLRDAIVSAAPGLVTEPKDARFAVEGDSVRVIPGEDGTTVDGALAADAVNRLRHEVLRAPISLTIIRHPSTFKTEEALALGITQRVATFTTAFDPTNSPRVHNIDLMAEATDGSLVKPGETFSLNDTTGPRDEFHGYREAQIILNGELVPGIGGGVCQFGTTLFNAVFFAGLDVKERHNHSLYISKYPVGRDATVFFDGGRDLSFRNDTPNGILVKATVNKKSLTISLYSTPVGRTVTYETSPRRNPKPAPTKYVDDPMLPAGQEVVQEPGQPGFDITVVRTVKEGDKVIHRDTFVSKYRPWKHIVRRGTGPPAPSPSPSGSPAPAVPV
jgi:vancomycin resistance protein YoaR